MVELDPTRINPAHLRALIAVAEARTFSQAALDLQVSQSAVSYAIATLEAELGVVLVSRGRYGAHPTPIGEQIVLQARQVLQLLESMIQSADSTKGLRGGSLRIGCFRSVATHILPTLLTQFRDRFPDVSIVLTEYFGATEVEQALRKGQVDLGFTVLPTHEEFEVWELVQDEYFVLLPPTAQASQAQLSWEALADYSFVTCSANTCHTPVYQHLAEWNVRLKTVYDVQESSTAVGMVAQGLGAAILARLSALPIPPEVQIHRLPVPLKRVIGIAAQSNALWTPAMFAFLNSLPCVDEKTALTVERLHSAEGINSINRLYADI
jgi:DNA-binding transcriptional LysR family regulator